MPRHPTAGSLPHLLIAPRWPAHVQAPAAEGDAVSFVPPVMMRELRLMPSRGPASPWPLANARPSARQPLRMDPRQQVMFGGRPRRASGSTSSTRSRRPHSPRAFARVALCALLSLTAPFAPPVLGDVFPVADAILTPTRGLPTQFSSSTTGTLSIPASNPRWKVQAGSCRRSKHSLLPFRNLNPPEGEATLSSFLPDDSAMRETDCLGLRASRYCHHPHHRDDDDRQAHQRA